ncbi:MULTISPECIES: RnfABCDGE type electron transport complex subunit G [Pseudomonas]|uniref:Ion-translocating oxidoreductase complex subunit G n=1 Tax=Pseudomonas gingeri TaxID=117681 RepID=A0A7Y7WU13_9PSED|nr:MULTISPECIES: RnfABCDGE type electron transport complex subunit G [Pseudomonas]MPQ70378.1 RnfABCDGE type electron transport complex subunit G [Pseudomonas sp. MWU12-2323]NWB87701.1 RnfABCDGE type electron transport complex subunit G [Pseudomonas gingeri]
MNRTASALILLAIAGLGIGLTWQARQHAWPRVQEQREAIENRRLLDVLPPGQYQNRPLLLEAPQQPHSLLISAVLMLKDGQPAAVVLQSRTQGYAGPLELMIGIGANGRLLGVKTLSHSETPGLGAKIADPGNLWWRQWLGKSSADTPDNDWKLKKDGGQFDQIAGATITSRAAVDAIHDALRYFDEHLAPLMGTTAHE